MLLTRHQAEQGARWASDGYFLPPTLSPSALLELHHDEMMRLLINLPREESTTGELLAPIDPAHEVWAAGVTYLRSRDARREESKVADVYSLVYDAVRPELFLKSIGWRVVGNRMPIRVRRDSHWNVPEPEMVLVINRHREIVGYCAGNDVSSRDIEGENPLYLPQAKIYNGSCALGHGIWLCASEELDNLSIRLQVQREGAMLFNGETTTAQMKRKPQELVDYLMREIDFPHGVFLMTGTGIVPGENFSLRDGDRVLIQVGGTAIDNPVQGDAVT
jgi:2-dehydro-3-deoxy-D-arabinonate dehydratase